MQTDYRSPDWPKEAPGSPHGLEDELEIRDGSEIPRVDDRFWIGLCWGALIMIPIWTGLIIFVDWVSG